MFNIPFHLLIIHFPIALSVLAAGYDLKAHFGKRPELHRTGLQLLGDRNQASRATMHAALGLVTGLTLLVLAMIRYSADARRSEVSGSGLEPWLVIEVLAAVAVIATAVTGHRLVLGY